MKNFSITAITVFISSVCFGQYFTDIDWQKQKLPAVQTSVPFSESIVEDAIKLEMGKLGYSPAQEKGGILYKAVKIAEIGPGAYDLLFKVQRKGKRESESADIYMAVSRGNNNYVQPNDSDSLPHTAKKFAGHFLGWAEAQALEVGIKEQDEKVKTSQKKLQSLIDEGVQLEKKLQKLQQDILDNRQFVEKQKTDVDVKSKALEALMKKRKT